MSNPKKDELELSGMHSGATPQIFKNAAQLRLNMTETEIILWNYLRTKPNGFKFRRQHPIHVYILDFYCHKLRLSIEIDGGYHLDKEQKEKDKERTVHIEGLGIKEIRFSNNEVIHNLENVYKIIENELRAESL